jgi:dihydropteroate synthase
MPRRKPRFKDKTYVMGILNVTPDSFSDGGMFFEPDAAVKRGIEIAREGADIIDVGGESTRPGALGVSVDDEIGRVVPVIEGLAKKIDIPISIDTRKSETAEAAVKAGASIINDVSGLRDDERIASVAARHGAMLIVMHMKGTPADMQIAPEYKDLIGEISEGLRASVSKALAAGVLKENIIIDPGIGFGKTAEHNLEILSRLGEFKRLGYPVCAGTSRKSFIGKVLDLPGTDDRLIGSIATAVIAAMNGADILRAHDVLQTRQAVFMTDAVKRAVKD